VRGKRLAALGIVSTKCSLFFMFFSVYICCTSEVLGHECSLNIEATFTTSPCSGCKGEILISDQTEESFLHTGEWSQYIAAFFNRVSHFARHYQLRNRVLCATLARAFPTRV